jgi:hypothetical protein
MSKNASPLHPVDPVGDLALDWQIGRVFWQPASSQNNSPPGGVVLLGVAAGALEGVIVGIAHGGFDCVILSLLWGVMIGVCASIYVWRIRENVRHIVLSMLLGIAIETIGGFLIVFFTPMFGAISGEGPSIVLAALRFPSRSCWQYGSFIAKSSARFAD